MEMNKYFVFSDVHGEYKALMNSLKEAGYDSSNPRHILLSLGDNFDRGEYSREIYDFLRRYNHICVKGNHDVMFEEFLDKGSDGEFVLFNILHNGMGETIKSFSHGSFDPSIPFNYNHLDAIKDWITTSYTDLKKFMSSMRLYYETEHFIFVHAGIEPYISDWKNTPEHFMLWDIEHSHEAVPCTKKIVVIGHHHAAKVRAHGEEGKQREDNLTIPYYGNQDENRPYKFRNKIAIDGLTNLTHKVNVLVIEDKPIDEEAPTDKKEEETIVVGSDGMISRNDNIVFIKQGNYTYTINATNPFVTTTTTYEPYTNIWDHYNNN